MTANDLTLWGIGTPRTMRAHWMLIEYGLDYDSRPIQPRTGETMTAAFLALNPKHKVPVLRHGEIVLSESAAILGYISEAFPTPPGFFEPKDAALRAKLAEWCFFIMMELDALSLYVIRRHGDLHAIYGEAPNAVACAKEYFREQAGAVFANFAADRATLIPEGMSVADILLTTCIDSALRRAMVVPPPLIPYFERMSARPAYQRAVARNFPDRAGKHVP